MAQLAQQRSIEVKLFGAVALLALAFLLIGCGGAAGETAVNESAAVEPAAGIEAALALEEAAAAESVGVETAVAITETVTDTVAITDECLICHLDKEMLIRTADPVEEVVSENEGEG